MLLKKYFLFLIFIISLPSFAANWEIIKKENDYFLKNETNQYELVYNGVPKILSSQEKNGLYIIDYFAGDYGTSQKSLITRRVIILKKDMSKVADDILKVQMDTDTIESKWDFDSKNNLIKVHDPDLDITKKYAY